MAEVIEDISQPAPEQEFASSPDPSVQERAEEVAQPGSEKRLDKDPLAERISAKLKDTFLPEDAEFMLAKSYLSSKMGVSHPVSLYDHLTSLIMHAMESKSSNVVDNFEKLSLSIKSGQYAVGGPTTIRDVKENHIQHAHAKQRLAQLKRPSDESAEAEAGDIPDMMDLASLWEWAGVSFGKEDTFLLFLSIKKLVETKQLKSVRLWGKIYGTRQNYIIAEAELKEGVEDVEDAIVNATEVVEGAVGESKSKSPADAKLPVPKTKQYANLSKESRTGANKYIYYVCHVVGGPWSRLPDVIPERLQESRKIRKYFTGVLDTKINSYPSFKGNEAQYLRCQIARISAATVVSPKGYYMIDPDAEDPEESNTSPPIVINPEFEGIPNDQLINVSNWVHHVPYVLPQGKVTWESPKVVKEEVAGEEGEEKEEEEEAEDESTPAEPETGPAPLTPISSDEENGNVTAWVSRVCSSLSPIKFSPVTLRSNRWPGACVLAYSDKFANIYIGDGLKDLGNPAQNFIPPTLGSVQKEFVLVEGADPNTLTEQLDPTVEAETAFEEAKKSKDEDGKAAEGEEGAEADE